MSVPPSEKYNVTKRLEYNMHDAQTLESTPGRYKVVVIVDGNSLYGSIVAKLGIFIDTCAHPDTCESLETEMGRQMPSEMERLHVEETGGFLNVSSTPQSKLGGRIRTLVCDLGIRLATE
ncbi:hypothetical protein CBER1_10931 [Cercospora berteroae]|uniref:Uncharacterized protein n=1 Tax=Cercospora berteroae TaxID=357750 RepID=A0A2S6C9P5_9PEZI|nr:hypothetical protein CBER1_10931 [Cercospora berteroae]